MKKRKFFLKNIFYIATITTIILTSCSSKKYDVTHKNGVEHIHNYNTGIWDGSAHIIMDKILTIGYKNNEENNFIFARIGDVKIDAIGNIYVCDGMNHNINIFDQRGIYIKKIGNKGKGPGELFAPSILGINQNRDILVYEVGNRRVSIFNSIGNYLSNFSIDFSVQDMLVDQTSGEIYIYRLIEPYGEQPDTIKSIYKYDQTGNLLYTFSQPPIIGRTSIGTTYSGAFLASLSNSNLLCAFSFPYKIRIFQNDKIIKEIEKDSHIFTDPMLFKYGRSQIYINSAYITNCLVLPNDFILLQIYNRGKNVIEEYKKYRDSRNSGKYYQMPLEVTYDLFNSKGEFLQSFNTPLNGGYVRCIDKNGYVYVQNTKDDIPIIEKYRIAIKYKNKFLW